MNNRHYGWGKLNQPVEPNFGKGKVRGTVSVSDQTKMARKASVEHQTPTPVQLPHHLFVPAGAESLDIRVAADIGASTLAPTLLMDFQCPKGAVCHFIQYAVFSDGALAANQQFIPRVDGKRAFPYQGDPNDNFKINLGLAPDLSNNSLIQCQLTLNPTEKIEWFVINANLVDVAMGVRMVGYIDYGQQRINARSGG
jgi:hypothetical protein